MILLSLCVYSYAQQIIKPGVKTPTTFAIVVDSTSYENAKSALEAYKQSVEADGWVLIFWCIIGNLLNRFVSC